jgi:hypothetical protein
MVAVYYLETGGELRASGARSYKSRFFEWVGTQPKWRFLEAYEPIVGEHDDRFRTGEFHKGSVLRRAIFGHGIPELNDIMELSNSMLNGIWPNMLEIIQGRWPNQFSRFHFISDEDMAINPRYLPPESE